MDKKLTAIIISLSSLILGALISFLLPFGMEGKKIFLESLYIESFEAEEVEYGIRFVPDILSNALYYDAESIHSILESQKNRAVKSSVKHEVIANSIWNAINNMGSYSRYYQYKEKICLEVNGTKYGAYVNDGDSPIGGGVGYKDIITSGDYIVSNIDELLDALEKAKSGEVVFIKGDASIDITSNHLIVKQGVTLASDRGHVGDNGNVSYGAVLRTVSASGRAIDVQEGGRITGLTLMGGDPNQHIAHHYRANYGSNPRGKAYYYTLGYVSTYGILAVGNDVRIDNCEITGFGYAGIIPYNSVKNLLVQYCYIHHNQAQGLGYGVCHETDSESIVEYCLFNFNRHSIAANGAPKTGYIARFNVEMGDSLSTNFDIHGGVDRGDGTNIAGTYCEIYNNTFLSDAHPYWLRGVPEEYQVFYHNNVLNRYESFNSNRLTGENVEIYDNIFGISGVIVRE
ncbi:MAG: hypothetical protein E7665_04960 [Ruminococcaceae bacterium]|nr:hypothetical protein [Oscillospiraceae bacterium]